MKMIIISLTIAVLLGSSEAGPTKVKSYSELNSSSTLNVTAPLGPIRISMVEVEGGSLMMTCRAAGDQLSYNWTAEGGLLYNERQFRQHLTITRFEKANDRNFCCIASNVAGQVQECTRVSRFVRLFTPDELISVGDSFELKCQVFGSDASKIHLQWQRPTDQEFSKNATIIDGVLKIHSVTIADGGSYYCIGLDKDGNQLIRKEYRLALPGSPMIGFSIDARNFAIGGSLSVTCQVYGEEPMTVELKTEDYVLLSNEKIEGLVVTVDNIPEYFQRTYKCTASNRFGTFSERTHQSVQRYGY